jgi:hypothetical protein
VVNPTATQAVADGHATPTSSADGDAELATPPARPIAPVDRGELAATDWGLESALVKSTTAARIARQRAIRDRVNVS